MRSGLSAAENDLKIARDENSRLRALIEIRPIQPDILQPHPHPPPVPVPAPVPPPVPKPVPQPGYDDPSLLAKA